MNKTDIFHGLNLSQQEAVRFPNKPLLIIAGAGSGKTKILVHRIAHLLLQGVPPFQILGVTFTNKAASEMKHRVQRLVEKEVWVSTFHSTCLRILRMDGIAIGLDKNFTIYDDHDQKILVKQCIQELKLNEKQYHPKGIIERISRAKDALQSPRLFAEKANDLYESCVARVYERYEKKLEFLKGCDFGDLIFKTVQLFHEKPAILQTWQTRFQHILVDEYQDTNHAQYRLVMQLASHYRQITVVGDPDQSIYSWRGADIQNILRFEKDFPECGIINLERNYRSSSVILDAANELISRNTMRKRKVLWTDRVGGEKITLYDGLDEKSEAQYVVRKIQQYISQGRRLSDQVVFYRVHAQSRNIEDELRRAKIPYKIIGGVRYYDRMEIKDIIAYLRVVANPHDEVSLKRILNVPARGIGKKALEILENETVSKQCLFYETLAQAGSLESLTPKTKKSIEALMMMFQRTREEAKTETVSGVLESILKNTQYVEELESEKSVESQSRIENIQEFFSVIQDFEERTDRADGQSQLQAFLESISLVTDLDQWDASSDVLTLMTLHTAKGLEFPIVYMIGMEEGLFPNVNSYTDDLGDLEEERRLCYVGITRAKEKIYWTYAKQRRLYGAVQRNLPSRFLTEIPQDFFESGAFYRVPDLDDNPFLDDIDIISDTDLTARKSPFRYENFEF